MRLIFFLTLKLSTPFIEGNIEELKVNAGYRGYGAIGFDNSNKDYYIK